MNSRNLTPAEYAAIRARGHTPAAPPVARRPRTPKFARPVAVAVTDADDGLNKTERRFKELLELRKCAGEIIDYRVQAVTLRIGPDARYVPDFLVIEADRTMTFVEVKGWLREDAQLRWRVAQEKFPWFKFVMVQEQRGGGFVQVSGKRAKRKNERIKQIAQENQ